MNISRYKLYNYNVILEYLNSILFLFLGYLVCKEKWILILFFLYEMIDF